MAKPVKKRAYESPVRQEQAAHTRVRILDAASELFARDGYARTTIKAIAADAGVAADTIYAAFGSKPRVLTALIDLRLAPAGEGNVMERPEALAIRDESDQAKQVAMFARDIAGVTVRVRPMYEIMRTASAVEPEMGDVFREMETYRKRNMRTVADRIVANGPLRVSADRAAEIMWALASPDMARALCGEQGWTTDEFGEWLTDTLTRTLLPDPVPRHARARRK